MFIGIEELSLFPFLAKILAGGPMPAAPALSAVAFLACRNLGIGSSEGGSLGGEAGLPTVALAKVGSLTYF
jgi:hypothetical protein